MIQWSKFESQIIDRVSNLQGEGKYDEAVEMIDNALKVLPNSNELISKKDKIVAAKPLNFMDMCESYETSYNYEKYINGETFQMSGQDRTNGFTIMGYNNQALANLDGKYKELSFDVGHVDGADMLMLHYQYTWMELFFNLMLLRRMLYQLVCEFHLKERNKLNFLLKMVVQ